MELFNYILLLLFLKLLVCNGLINNRPSLSQTIFCSISNFPSYYHHNQDNIHYKNKIIMYHKQRRNTITQLNARLRKSPSFRNQNTMANSIIFMNVICFLLASKFPNLQRKFMKIDYRIAGGETYRLLTSLFLHGGMYHLLMNSYSLYQIGPQAEKVFGSAKFLMIYLFSGLLANTGTYLAGTAPYSLGASGSTFGLIGALAAYYYTNRNILGRKSELALQNIKQMMLINLFYGCAMKNIDNWAHIGGFISGALLAYFAGPKISSRMRSVFPQNNNIWRGSNWRSRMISPTTTTTTYKATANNNNMMMNNYNKINYKSKLTFQMKCQILYHQLQNTFYQTLSRLGIKMNPKKNSNYSNYSKYNNYQPYDIQTATEYGNLLEDE